MNIKIERSIRQALCPCRYGSWGSKFKCSSLNGSKPLFNIDHMLLVNIIQDMLIQNYWDGRNNGEIPKSWKNPIVWKGIKPLIHRGDWFNIYNGTSTERSKDYTYTYLYNKYPFLKERIKHAGSLKKLILELNNMRFNLVMRVRAVYHAKKKMYNYQTHKDYNKEYPEYDSFFMNTMNKPASKLFNFEITKEEKFSRGGISDIEFHIKMNNIYFYSMYQGAMYVTIDWIPEEIYTLKMNNYSKFLYILMLAGKVKKDYEYNLGEIVEKLQLKPNQKKSQLCMLIDRYLDDLVQNNFIEVESRGGFKNRRYIINRK